MMQLILIGVGAGVVTALLFASVASGALLSIFLFYLAPLPILIAALGWSHWAALVAAVTAAAGLAAFLSPFFFITFLSVSGFRPGGSAIWPCSGARAERARRNGMVSGRPHRGLGCASSAPAS